MSVITSTDELELRIARLERDSMRWKHLTWVALTLAVLAVGHTTLTARSADAQTRQTIIADSIFARRIYVTDPANSSGGITIIADGPRADIGMISPSNPNNYVILTVDADKATVSADGATGMNAQMGPRSDTGGAFRVIGPPTAPGQDFDTIIWSAP